MKSNNVFHEVMPDPADTNLRTDYSKNLFFIYMDKIYTPQEEHSLLTGPSLVL